jgi:serine/threonine-protein kinase
MSPELIRSAKLVDARTDIWALGLILAECITGEPVYQGTTKFGILAAIAADPVPALHLGRAGAPPELEKVILRCLEKDPDQRYQTVAELALDLVPFAGEKSISAASRIGRMVRPPSGRRSIAARRTLQGAAILLVAGVVVAAALGLRVRSSKIEQGRAASIPENSTYEPVREPSPAPNVEAELPAQPPATAAASNAAEIPRSGHKSNTKAAGPATKSPTRGAVDAHTAHPPAQSAPPDGLEDRK